MALCGFGPKGPRLLRGARHPAMIGSMDPIRWLIALALVVLPLAWWLWRESRDRAPENLWPQLAPGLGLKYSGPPPALQGEWNGRPVFFLVEGGRTVASARYNPASRVRLEIGPREELERAAGMVVPDRVEFPEDRGFSGVFLVRAAPEEFGRLVVDATVRPRLTAHPGLHLLATGGRVDASLPEARHGDEFRDLLDLAVAVADAAEHSA